MGVGVVTFWAEALHRGGCGGSVDSQALGGRSGTGLSLEASAPLLAFGSSLPYSIYD